MQLNLKDPETHRLVTRLAEVTGLSKAGAVKEAVREKLQLVETAKQHDRTQRIADVLRMAAEIRARLPKPLPTQHELDDWMYDEHGLPH